MYDIHKAKSFFSSQKARLRPSQQPFSIFVGQTSAVQSANDPLSLSFSLSSFTLVTLLTNETVDEGFHMPEQTAASGEICQPLLDPQPTLVCSGTTLSPCPLVSRSTKAAQASRAWRFSAV